MGKNMTTLGNVFDLVHALSANCTDRLVAVDKISFDKLETVNIDGITHGMRPIAQRSIACRLGIPFQYLQKCPSQIQAVNMNHWIEKERNDHLFFRFDGEDVRAVFTPRYKPVDNIEILQKLDSLKYGPDTEVQCHLDAEFMLLNILNGHESFSINGDRMRPGISISNSEVGLAALSISAFILRLVCTNGLIARTRMDNSYRHVSTRILDRFSEVLDTVSLELENQRRQFRLSTQSEVKDPLSTIESFNRQFQLSERERKAVEWAWPQEAGETMFHIVNAYTRAAQIDGLSAESGYRLQKVSGDILAMLN